MGERKRIGIEALLRWAYRDELPKAQAETGGERYPGPGMASAHGSVRGLSELGVVVDETRNRWGLVVDRTAQSEPHPDAVAVGRAVMALDTFQLGIPDDWHPLGDMAAVEGAEILIARTIALAVSAVTKVDEAGERRLRRTAGFLVMRHALLGGTPDWEADLPVVVAESANGKARWFRTVTLADAAGQPYDVEVNGYDPKAKRPMRGAYRKLRLDPDPLDAAIGRAEYEVWRAALDVLHEDLSAESVLADHLVQPSDLPRRPWTDGGLPARTVLAPRGGWMTIDAFRHERRRGGC